MTEDMMFLDQLYIQYSTDCIRLCVDSYVNSVRIQQSWDKKKLFFILGSFQNVNK